MYIAIKGDSKENIFSNIRQTAKRIYDELDFLTGPISDAIEDVIKILQQNPREALYDPSDELCSHEIKFRKFIVASDNAL